MRHEGRSIVGAASGLVAGAVVGLGLGGYQDILGALGALAGNPVATLLLGIEAPAVGLALHLAMSAAAGAAFGVSLGAVARSAMEKAVYGLLYGVALYALGPLTLVPVLLGADVTAAWAAALAPERLATLLAHGAYGLALGVVGERARAEDARRDLAAR